MNRLGFKSKEEFEEASAELTYLLEDLYEDEIIMYKDKNIPYREDILKTFENVKITKENAHLRKKQKMCSDLHAEKNAKKEYNRLLAS